MLTGQILLQIIVILIVVQIFGHLCRRIGQQWVIGEIFAGLALGPSFLGALLPGVKTFLFPASTLSTFQVLGDIGLILYMFSLGARLDIHLMLSQKRTAVLASISGILLPLLLGMGLAFWLYPGFAGAKTGLTSFMLLVGTAMAITAFPVLARILTERNMLGTRLGTLALTCAAVDDVIAWCLLALVVTVIHATGVFAAVATVGLTLVFALCILFLVRPLLAEAARRLTSKPLLIAFCMVLVLFSSYCTNAIGIHPIFGAFLMGVILPRKP
ncbi:MAG TPA: cation:proton antiporter, partial [Ktedonobacteraceae bacterium]|nr:cation:proton antiporter [Ktedonobacteraceae bacterium]